MNVLIADPDSEWSNKLKKFLSQNNISTETAQTGRDSQLKIYLQKFESVIIDADVKKQSIMEVLKYIKMNHPSTKVVLTFHDQARMDQLGFNKENMKKMGVTESFVKPFAEAAILRCFTGESEVAAWKEMSSAGKSTKEEEVKGADDDFSKVHVSTFVGNDVTVLNYYIQLGPGKYVKLFHQGESFKDQDLRDMIEKKKLEYLYFKKSDRRLYINFMNDFLNDASTKGTCVGNTGLKTYEQVIDQYMSEIYDSGINHDLVDEGMKVCASMFQLIQGNRSLKEVILSLGIEYPTAHRVSFLSAFFSVLISKNLEWANRRTTEYTAFGALLSSIGMIKIAPALKVKSFEDLSASEKLEYSLYPKHGAEILSQYHYIEEPVRQIVYQHRELADGNGYPNKLRASQIYPLARIVSVAVGFSEKIVSQDITILEALREFATDRANLAKYDSQFIRALIMGFTTKKNQQ